MPYITYIHVSKHARTLPEKALNSILKMFMTVDCNWRLDILFYLFYTGKCNYPVKHLEHIFLLSCMDYHHKYDTCFHILPHRTRYLFMKKVIHSTEINDKIG